MLCEPLLQCCLTSILAFLAMSCLVPLACLVTARDGLRPLCALWAIPEVGFLLHCLLAQAILVSAEWPCLLNVPGLLVCFCSASYASQPPLPCQLFLPALHAPLLPEVEIISISMDVEILGLTFEKNPGLKNNLKGATFPSKKGQVLASVTFCLLSIFFLCMFIPI